MRQFCIVVCVCTHTVESNSGPWVLNPCIPDPWVLRSTEYSIPVEEGWPLCKTCWPRGECGVHTMWIWRYPSIKSEFITWSTFVFSYGLFSETTLGLLTTSKYSGALRTVQVFEIHYIAVVLMLYLWNSKDLSASAQLPHERPYTLGDKNHKPRPLVPNGQGHAHG